MVGDAARPAGDRSRRERGDADELQAAVAKGEDRSGLGAPSDLDFGGSYEKPEDLTGDAGSFKQSKKGGL